MATLVYTATGRVVGQIDGNVYYTRRKRSVHMLRKPPAWAIDRAILLDLAGGGVERIELHDQETGQTYTAGLADFWRHGIRVNRGHGEQVALPLAWWRVDGQRSQFEMQAARETAQRAQLTIWGLTDGRPDA